MDRVDIFVTKVNDVYLQAQCEKSIRYELADYFAFYAPGYKFNPKFKNKLWDGKIRLCRIDNGLMYYGLHKELEKFAAERDYHIVYDESFGQTSELTYDRQELGQAKYEPRDYQIDAVSFALKHKRCVLVSPTASGKSYIIYMIMKHLKKRTLLIVPNIGLVNQMASDFIEYNPKAASWIHKIMAGESKDTKKPIVISTWQSIYQESPEWFDQFEVVIGDECHQYKATSLTSIMEKCHNIEWRIGTTGTVANDNSSVHALVLQGLFGDIKVVAKTKELMDEGYLSQFKVEAIVLKHKDVDGKLVRKMSYQEELNFFVNHEKRNKFIAKLALTQKNNTLVLFQLVEKHGVPLYELMCKMAKDYDKNIYFIHGKVDGAEREVIRKKVNDSENNIIVASYGTFSTGINVPNLHNAIFATSYKSRIKNLQSIGRSLRLSSGKEIATLYDIVDDCSVKSKRNYSMQHFMERVKIYQEEKFRFKIRNIDF